MKYTIEGFSQEEAMKLQKTITENGKTKTISLDCIDLVLLRWFVDFFPSMMKVTIDGIQYAWVSYQAILDDMPLLGLGKRSLFDRLRKMSQLGVLVHKTVRSGGTFSYYGFGENYSLLIMKHTSDHVQNNSHPMKQTSEGYEANFRGGMKQTSEQINPSTIDNTSTKEPKKGRKSARSFDEIVNAYTSSDTTRELLGMWLQNRKAKRAAMTDNAIRLNLRKLDDYARQSGMTVDAYLQEVIRRGWSAFFVIKDYSQSPRAPQQTQAQTWDKTQEQLDEEAEADRVLFGI